MPSFGEYETIGDPLTRSGDAAHTRTLWAANRPLSKDGRIYVIKSVESLGLQPPGQPSGPGPFTTEPGAEFFDSVSRLKKAYQRNRDVIAPIHGFGTTDAGAWYATDFYPRQSLAEYESSPDDLNDAALQHVVYSVASGCLALQKTTGRSHGNLKASNVLRGGKSTPLRKTELRLIDPAGWPPNRPQPKVGATLRQATEASDVRRIGELILQLVEANPIAGPQDYSLPIEPSVPWRALGKNSKRWLELCNRLLNPNLSLADISLESLAKDFRSSGRSSGGAKWVAGFGFMLVAGVAAYLATNDPWQQRMKTWWPELTKLASDQLNAVRAVGSSTPVAREATTKDGSAPAQTQEPEGRFGNDQRHGVRPPNDRAATAPAPSAATIVESEAASPTLNPREQPLQTVPNTSASTRETASNSDPVDTTTLPVVAKNQAGNAEPQAVESSAKAAVSSPDPVDPTVPSVVSTTPPIDSEPKDTPSAPAAASSQKAVEPVEPAAPPLYSSTQSINIESTEREPGSENAGPNPKAAHASGPLLVLKPEAPPPESSNVELGAQTEIPRPIDSTQPPPDSSTPTIHLEPKPTESLTQTRVPDPKAAGSASPGVAAHSPVVHSEPKDIASTTRPAVANPSSFEPATVHPVESSTPAVNAPAEEPEQVARTAGANRDSAGSSVPPVLSSPESSLAQSAEVRERFPAQQSPVDGARNAEPSRAPAPPQRAANGTVSQARPPRTEPGKRRELAKATTPVQQPTVSLSALEKQLRRLDSKVNGVVTVRRNSDLFDQLNSLEAQYWQYAKANRPSKDVRDLIELVRGKLMKKLIGPPPQPLIIEPFIPSVVGRSRGVDGGANLELNPARDVRRQQ